MRSRFAVAGSSHNVRKSVVKAAGDLLEGQHTGARRRQFQRQRDAVQPTADMAHRPRIRFCQGKPGPDPFHPLQNLRELAHS